MRSHGQLRLQPAQQSSRDPLAVAYPLRTRTVSDDNLRVSRGLFAVAWLPAIILLGIVDCVRRAPQALAAYHDVGCIAFAVGAISALAIVAYQVGRPRYPLVRRRLALVAGGAMVGLVLPLVLLAHAGLDQKTLAAALALACAFPLACIRAARTVDLFALNLLLRRTVTYTVVVGGMGLAELALLAALDRGAAHLVMLDVTHIAFGNLVLLLIIPLLHEQVAGAVMRRLSPHMYNSRQQLARFSDALGGAQTVEGVRRALSDVLRHSINPTHHQLYVEDKHGQFAPLKGDDGSPATVNLPKRILDEMRQGHTAYRFRHDDGRSPQTTALWSELGIDVFVPIFTGGVTHAVLALGSKRSRVSYHADDLAFLRAAAAQAALGLTNARAFAQLRQMNSTLERTVDERTAAERATTAALQSSNAELAKSLDELRHAYSQLEQNHACLLRADRLATLGRLTAGIAHEVNTPLSAVQNSLRILRELGEEYAASIDDSSVRPDDHRGIADEIITTARSAADWADKAARYIRGTKAHSRTAPATAAEPFLVRDIIDEVRTLLVHRLRVANCTLDCQEPRPGLTVVGDRSTFSQVMINIVSNALDAYEDARATNSRILVSISQPADTVTVEIRDWAGGIPLQVLPRIFEELFTTKSTGRGTGLGLWISRTIIEKEFGGCLDVMSVPGEGSCFIATIPAVPAATSQPSVAPLVAQEIAA